VQQAPAPVQEAAKAQNVQAQSEPQAAATTVVQGAPADMESVIDDLLK
jgi:hypothetical protein